VAPEIFEGEPPTHASDIWSLGCTVIELVTGNPPHHQLGPVAAVYHILEDECPPLPAAMSEDGIDFLKRCFTKSPSDRPTANDLLRHPWIRQHSVNSRSSTSLVKRVRTNETNQRQRSLAPTHPRTLARLLARMLNTSVVCT